MNIIVKNMKCAEFSAKTVSVVSNTKALKMI